jgi:hypothetical protein
VLRSVQVFMIHAYRDSCRCLWPAFFVRRFMCVIFDLYAYSVGTHLPLSRSPCSSSSVALRAYMNSRPQRFARGSTLHFNFKENGLLFAFIELTAVIIHLILFPPWSIYGCRMSAVVWYFSGHISLILVNFFIWSFNLFDNCSFFRFFDKDVYSHKTWNNGANVENFSGLYDYIPVYM